MASISFGASFSPEYATRISKVDPLQPIEILKYSHEKLGITDFRLGLRWNRTQVKSGAVSLDYYRPYLDYVLEKPCKVTLNIGPIKVFRYPEEHIPSYLKHLQQDYITPETELAKHAYEYHEKLLGLLKKEYGRKLDNVTFQPENECYYPFGHYHMVMSDEYLMAIIKTIARTFPASRLMMDSAGRSNLTQITSIFERLVADGIYGGSDLTLGFNYYFMIPIRNLVLRTMLRLIPRKDPIIFAAPTAMTISKLHHKQKAIGFDLEISEGQFEPWTSIKSPGNSIKDFDYLVKRASKLFSKDSSCKLIRLWGIEGFVWKLMTGRANQIHSEIARRIHMLQ